MEERGGGDREVGGKDSGELRVRGPPVTAMYRVMGGDSGRRFLQKTKRNGQAKKKELI